MDTYRTFGCESGQPTFRYSLMDGIKDGYLINPTVADARTEVTTQLLAAQGFVVSFADDTGMSMKRHSSSGSLRSASSLKRQTRSSARHSWRTR